jgi:ribosomal protein S18 acetylase RimI-like enzyme
MGNPPLPLGYSPLAPRHIATVVTWLEMTRRPSPGPSHPPKGEAALRPLAGGVEAYRALFRAVGEDWLWVSRLAIPDAELRSILADPRVELCVLHQGSQPIGLLELDFRIGGECELAFFGLVPDAIGRGFGRALMAEALARAWAKPIKRFWVHTCSLDHPAALGFYRKAGFRPYKFAVEVIEDPRLTGLLPRSAAPHIPMIEG